MGHEVVPQKVIGRYRVDLFLPDFVPPVVIEGDGNRFHGADRSAADEAREQWLGARGYNVVRFRWSDYKDKPGAIRGGLSAVLDSAGGGKQLKFA